MQNVGSTLFLFVFKAVHTERFCRRHRNKRHIDRQMGLQPVLPVTVPIKKIEGAHRQCYGDGDGVVRCEQTLPQLEVEFSVRV